jgi:glycerol-3-phosphate dehydrogenase (NAD(P)+)
MSREEAEAKLVQVAEGVPATRSTWKLAREQGIRAPVTEVVHRMLFEGLPAAAAVGVLMERDLRREHEEE